MTKNDYVIICGDFGGVWDGSNEEKYWIKWLKSKNFTTLFVDGEYMKILTMLYSLPTVEFLAGAAHKIDEWNLPFDARRESMRLTEKRFFVFGGADSHDKEHRTVGKNWWRCRNAYRTGIY